jgi:hypothetical protein
MSSVAIVWLVVGLTSTLGMLAVLIALVRHLMVLTRALGRFQDEVQPVVDEIATESQRASDRTSRLSRSALGPS